MSKFLILLICLILQKVIIGQTKATTEEGKKVWLSNDGTWEFMEKPEFEPKSKNHIFLSGKKIVSGEKTTIHEESGYDGLTTSVSIAKEGTQTIIVFWQDTEDDKINFFNELWTGTVMLFLEDGETISLKDRNIKGQNEIEKLFQRYSGHYLTPAECSKLKKSNLIRIAYQTTSGFTNGIQYLNISENKSTIAQQLVSIGR